MEQQGQSPLLSWCQAQLGLALSISGVTARSPSSRLCPGHHPGRGEACWVARCCYWLLETSPGTYAKSRGSGLSKSSTLLILSSTAPGFTNALIGNLRAGLVAQR